MCPHGCGTSDPIHYKITYVIVRLRALRTRYVQNIKSMHSCIYICHIVTAASFSDGE